VALSDKYKCNDLHIKHYFQNTYRIALNLIY
jgi:hypothetical protein